MSFIDIPAGIPPKPLPEYYPIPSRNTAPS